MYIIKKLKDGEYTGSFRPFNDGGYFAFNNRVRTFNSLVLAIEDGVKYRNTLSLKNEDSHTGAVFLMGDLGESTYANELVKLIVSKLSTQSSDSNKQPDGIEVPLKECLGEEHVSPGDTTADNSKYMTDGKKESPAQPGNNVLNLVKDINKIRDKQIRLQEELSVLLAELKKELK